MNNEVLGGGTIKVVPYWWESPLAQQGTLGRARGRARRICSALKVDTLSQPTGVQWCERRKSGLNFNGWVNRL